MPLAAGAAAPDAEQAKHPLRPANDRLAVWRLVKMKVRHQRTLFIVSALAPALALFVAAITGCNVPGPSPSPSPSGSPSPSPSGSPSPSPSPSPGPEMAFVGAARCQACHPDTHAEWADTLHAGALETLKGIGQGENAECLACHTVGFGQNGGFIDEATTPELAGVQCENCHGPSGDHADNPGDLALRPSTSISSGVCGECHTGAHHPNAEQWEDSGHARIDEEVAGDLLEGGTFVANCGICHSGDVYVAAAIKGDEVPENMFAGMTAEDLNPITCVVCHNPHARTGNAAAPDTGRDFQLRHPEAVTPTASNEVSVVTDPSRYNLCGQCHHSRGRTWEATARGPHHSVQSNVYFGEMATTEGQDPLVARETTAHSSLAEQCATCHMYRQDFQDEEAPAISGHEFAVNFEACTMCHGANGETMTNALQQEIQNQLNDIADRLGDPSTWQYSAEGGPSEEQQAALADGIKQVRFLYSYVVSDGSLGVHNPGYVRAILERADEILTDMGM
jgi:hypothetical protein